MCGEQGNSLHALPMRRGSPPRVRGTGAIRSVKSQHTGITPACAGNSGHHGTRCGSRQDHPRVCGEQDVSIDSVTLAKGSPPRVRGTGKVATLFALQFGITPACAGNRHEIRCPPSVCEDHPRVCGEQVNRDFLSPPLQGSPPRVRGTDTNRSPIAGPRRITPACAGNSFVRVGG